MSILIPKNPYDRQSFTTFEPVFDCHTVRIRQLVFVFHVNLAWKDAFSSDEDEAVDRASDFPDFHNEWLVFEGGRYGGRHPPEKLPKVFASNPFTFATRQEAVAEATKYLHDQLRQTNARLTTILDCLESLK